MVFRYENDKKTKEYVWQNSWGLTTRSIGVMILTHGDDLGLVLPPRVTPIKAVIIPIGKEESVFAEANKIAEELHAGGIEVKVDARTKQTVGWKFNHYELTGLPLRFELGPKEVENRKVVVVRRDTKMREELGRTGLAERVGEILETMQREMLERATAAVFSKVKFCTDWTEFMTALDAKCIGLCPWCNERECEEAVKRDSKTVVRTFGHPDLQNSQQNPLFFKLEQREESLGHSLRSPVPRVSPLFWRSLDLPWHLSASFLSSIHLASRITHKLLFYD